MKLKRALGCKWVPSSVFVLIGLSQLATAGLPDLAVNYMRANATVHFRRQPISAGDCAYREGCVWTPGNRKLLLVDVGVMNVGKSDLVIGDPNQRPDLFKWSDCHGHYHLKGLATYRLLALSGRQVARTYKQGFCLRDDQPKGPYRGPAKYTCNFQGISAGWQDVYDASLDCQWVDISGVPPGAYNLEITVNPDRRFAESNYNNNRIMLRIHVPKIVRF